MTRPRTRVRTLAGLLVGLVAVSAAPSWAASAKDAYDRAVARERAVRAAGRAPVADLRRAAASFEAVVRRYPTSGYSDNALWEAAGLMEEAFLRFREGRDRDAAVRLLEWLAREYPFSPLLERVDEQLARLEKSPASPEPAAPAVTSGSEPGEEAGPVRVVASGIGRTVDGKSGALATVRAVRREALPQAVRVIVELDREIEFRDERLSGPARMFVDLRHARPSPALLDTTLTYSDDVVRRIRLGRHPPDTTRVVLDLDRVGRYSVFTLYNPFRIVIDCERALESSPATLVQTSIDAAEPPALGAPVAALGGPTLPPEAAPALAVSAAPAKIEARPAMSGTVTVPATPGANSSGNFSLARQLGLGVSRIVLDPGHGGHDPGAQATGLIESQLVLDVALRLEKLLLNQPGFEVVMTRRTDVFVPLEERTEIANGEAADLFLSIHANASANTQASGVETYYLNFASNPEAEAVAARENSGSGRSMRNLSDIVKAIALNTKLDESRDFAAAVQGAMVRRLRTQNKQVRNLGVKQAPFVVLIGAGMPSVLAEISFLTNKREAQLLRGTTYRQRIAEALFDAVIAYQRSLKRVGTVARQ
jgi:N-acetylmuramoyl-L-alanine amidase